MTIKENMDYFKMLSKHPKTKYFRFYLDVFNPKMPGGFVYIIQLGETDHYKIGMSIDVDKRLKQLQSRCPIPLKIVYRWFGYDYRYFEKALHDQFRKKHVTGEWFRLTTEDIMNLIDFYPGNHYIDIGKN